MSTDRLIAVIALCVAAAALSVSAWVAVDAAGNDRDACAKSADLVEALGRQGALTILQADSSLIRDCITE